MIQGGDPTGTGKGGESAFDGGAPIKDEFAAQCGNFDIVFDHFSALCHPTRAVLCDLLLVYAYRRC